MKGLTSRSTSGVTFIELLLVVAIIAVLGATSTPFLSRFVLQASFDSAHEELVSTLRKAQAYAMDNKNDETWGVCLLSNSLRLYSGTCGSPTLSEDFSVPPTVTVSGLSNLTFNLRGEPSSSQSITISTALESVVVSVNTAGGIEVN